MEKDWYNAQCNVRTSLGMQWPAQNLNATTTNMKLFMLQPFWVKCPGRSPFSHRMKAYHFMSTNLSKPTLLKGGKKSKTSPGAQAPLALCGPSPIHTAVNRGPVGPPWTSNLSIHSILYIHTFHPTVWEFQQLSHLSCGVWRFYIGIKGPQACDLCNATGHARATQKARRIWVENISSLFPFMVTSSVFPFMITSSPSWHSQHSTWINQSGTQIM